MATYTYTHTRLLVRNFAACFRFYRDMLGLKLVLGSEDDVYAEFETGGSVMLALFSQRLMSDATGTAHLPAAISAQDSIALCLEVADVDAACAALQQKGITFMTLPADRPAWGLRTAHFRDPDGHLIEISHNIPMPQ